MKARNARTKKLAATLSIFGALLVGVFYLALRDNPKQTAPTTPAPPKPPPAESQPENDLPTPAPAPIPTPPAGSPQSLFDKAVDQADRKNFLGARRLLVQALGMNPSATQRTNILQTMIPISNHLLKMAPDGPDVKIHKVRSGEYLTTLAKRFGRGTYNYGAIKFANRMHSDNLRAGQTLRIPTGTFSILVIKSDFRLYLMYEGAAVREYRIAVGRGGESETPAATFTVGVRTQDPVWNPPEDLMRERGLPSVIPPGDPQNPLGTHWIALNHHSYQSFGIHGTDTDAVLGTEATYGCIRLSNDEVAELFHIVARGMSVTILD